MNLVSLVYFSAITLLLAGLIFDWPMAFWAGGFALSGALTNALAIHMLFEKVPGMAGSGVIAARFDDVTAALHRLMMTQFFTQDNIERFLFSETETQRIDLSPLIEQADLTPAYDRLSEVILASKFGGALSLFGGEKALQSLKTPFLTNLKSALQEVTQSDEFQDVLHAQMNSQMDRPDVLDRLQQDVSRIIEARLAELTPESVKVIVQTLIKDHLSWLVIWGGVLGGLIGLASAFLARFVGA
ncbi:DUF445 family protein [Thiomicrospira sp. WB1]|uniref:DUF445 family protein n=1 Tax=Thiomicrospira sp. WB1 TaxID=1685380 RepID=UPI0007485490|nr:DUF445 family protein [Thiomicrospira sp. WB1]KUJ72052.1 hypothetical protein AVO41_06335 [Thiomicrospira sp. WB1]